MSTKPKAHANGYCLAAAGILTAVGGFLSDVPGAHGACLILIGLVIGLVIASLLMENHA